MHRRMILVMHGKAAADERFRAAVETVRTLGHRVRVLVTWEGGDARLLAREVRCMVEAGEADTIVAVGGDGTLNDLVWGAMEKGPFPDAGSLAVLPAGTANDFARSIGFDPATPEETLLRIAEADPVPIDVGTCKTEEGLRFFLNVATAGYGSQVTAMTDPLLKRVLGSIAYVLTGIGRASEIEPVKARISAPGFAWEGAFATLAIGNGRQAGGGFVLCPAARLDDGLLDLALLPAEAVGGLGDALTVGVEGMEAIDDRMVRVRADRFTIEACDPAPFNLDGEPVSGRRFVFGLLPKAVRFHIGETDLAGSHIQTAPQGART